MKTEAELRAYINDLKFLLRLPCDCQGTRHATECHEGRLMMTHSIATLTWALGESKEADVLVENTAKMAAEIAADYEARH